jgi:hypothetical protein
MMRRLLFIRFEAACVATAFILALPVVAFAGKKIKDRSPDGQFAMSLQNEEEHEVRITSLKLRRMKSCKIVR